MVSEFLAFNFLGEENTLTAVVFFYALSVLTNYTILNMQWWCCTNQHLSYTKTLQQRFIDNGKSRFVSQQSQVKSVLHEMIEIWRLPIRTCKSVIARHKLIKLLTVNYSEILQKLWSRRRIKLQQNYMVSKISTALVLHDNQKYWNPTKRTYKYLKISLHPLGNENCRKNNTRSKLLAKMEYT